MSTGLAARTARAARGVADAGGAAPDAVHPAVLPRRQRRPGRQDLPVGVDGLPQGQGYGAFQLPSSLLLAASFGTAALFLVEDIEGGYFDKLRATPIPRTAIVLGRLIAELVKGLLISTAIVLLGAAVRHRHRQRPARLRAAGRADRAVGGRVRRLHAADRAQDAQRGGDQLRRPDLLPAAVPDAELRAARPADAADGDRGDASTRSPT